MARVTVYRKASDAKEPTTPLLADDLPPGRQLAESFAGVSDASNFKSIHLLILAAGLQSARTPTTRLESLQQLAAQLPPPEDQPMDMLDKSSACVIALSMRDVDAGQLGAAAAVPLVIAMLHYEVECKNKEEAGAIFSACIPHILAVTHWARTVQAKTHLGMPSLTYNTAVQQAARLCKLVADYANLSREERRGKKYFDPKQRLPPPDALAFDAACIAARASDIARWLVEAELLASHPSKVLGEEGFAALIDTAVGAALISLRALRLLHQAAGRFPRDAAPPTANAISNLLPVLPHWANKQILGTLSDTASLLTDVAGSITQNHAAQLDADIVTAAAHALTNAGRIEAAEQQNSSRGHGVAQPELTAEGQQQQQAAAEASAPQLRRSMSLSLAISHVVATTQMLAALSRGLLPSLERTLLLARLLWWAVEMQRLHPLLLLQQPVYSFEAEHGDHKGATRNELLSDQVLSVADAAAHGLAAAVLMLVSAGIRRRCKAMAAAGRSRRGKALPPCAPDAQLAAALPAINILVEAQAHCDWGDEPPDGAWQSAHALVTLAGHLADVLADADRTAAGSDTAAAGSSTTAGSSAAPAEPAAAAGTAADAHAAGFTGSGAGSATEGEHQAAWRAYTAAASQPSLGELVGTAVTGALVVAGWAANVLKQVQRDGSGVSVYPNRLEKAAAEQAYRAAELRPARLAVAAAGVLTDMAKCKAGRAALLEERQSVLHLILPPLEAALSLKGMHQGAAATAELAALVHDVAGLVGLLLTPDMPPAADAQRSIDSWRAFAADVQKRPHSACPRELLRAVAAVWKALQGGCTKSQGGGAAAAGRTDAEAAADAIAAELIQDESNAAAAAPGQAMRQHKGKKGRGGNKK